MLAGGGNGGNKKGVSAGAGVGNGTLPIGIAGPGSCAISCNGLAAWGVSICGVSSGIFEMANCCATFCKASGGVGMFSVFMTV